MSSAVRCWVEPWVGGAAVPTGRRCPVLGNRYSSPLPVLAPAVPGVAVPGKDPIAEVPGWPEVQHSPCTLR